MFELVELVIDVCLVYFELLCGFVEIVGVEDFDE